MNHRTDLLDADVFKEKYKKLIDEAKVLNLWIYGRYKYVEFWFSPSEFAKKNSVWMSKIQWKLRDPAEYVELVKVRIALFQEELKDIQTELFLNKK